MRLFFFGVLEFEVIELGPFGFDPGFEQLLITAARSTFQIQKAQSGSGRTSTPPFGSSAVKLATPDLDRNVDPAETRAPFGQRPTDEYCTYIRC
mgnify:CR=1 FL=1